jgi:hypothetical protein
MSLSGTDTDTHTEKDGERKRGVEREGQPEETGNRTVKKIGVHVDKIEEGASTKE